MSDIDSYTSDNASDIESDDEILPPIQTTKAHIPNLISSKIAATELDSDTDGDVDATDDEDDELPQDEEKEGEPGIDDDFALPSSLKVKQSSFLGEDEADDYGSDEDDSDEDEDENYLKKFNKQVNHDHISEYHPECISHNYDEISAVSSLVRDMDGNIVDDFHKTIPFLTKFERTRILGQRAKQINHGATPFIKVPEGIIEGHVIAELELREKKIPFIIKRPLNGGGCEYWKVKDLEDINF